MSALRNLFASERGATAVEYAIMLALILMVCIAGIALLGQSTSDSYNTSAQSIKTAMQTGS